MVRMPIRCLCGVTFNIGIEKVSLLIGLGFKYLLVILGRLGRFMEIGCYDLKWTGRERERGSEGEGRGRERRRGKWKTANHSTPKCA